MGCLSSPERGSGSVDVGVGLPPNLARQRKAAPLKRERATENILKAPQNGIENLTETHPFRFPAVAISNFMLLQYLVNYVIRIRFISSKLS